jgi:single stranded DNA-binding protein
METTMSEKKETSVNHVSLSGKLQNIILRSTKTGTPVAEATLVIVDGWRDDSREKYQYLSIVLWQGLATKAETLRDSLVRVEGKLRTDTWEDAGQRRSRLKIVASSLDPIQRLQEVPVKPKAEKLTGAQIADAILSKPGDSAITPAYPITDADIPF